MDDTSSSLKPPEPDSNVNLAGGEDILEVEEVISSVIGSSSGSTSARKRDILSDEEPALTERICLVLWFAMTVVVERLMDVTDGRVRVQNMSLV